MVIQKTLPKNKTLTSAMKYLLQGVYFHFKKITLNFKNTCSFDQQACSLLMKLSYFWLLVEKSKLYTSHQTSKVQECHSYLKYQSSS